MVVDIGVDLNMVIECRQPGCETRWVGSTCWNFRRLCEHAQCARSPDSRHISYLYCFCASFGAFGLYPLSFCSLQYIYEDLYCNYLSVCLRDNRKSYLYLISITKMTKLADVVLM